MQTDATFLALGQLYLPGQHEASESAFAQNE